MVPTGSHSVKLSGCGLTGNHKLKMRAHVYMLVASNFEPLKWAPEGHVGSEH